MPAHSQGKQPYTIISYDMMHAFFRDRVTAPKRLKEEMSYGQMEALATLLAQWVAEGGDALTLEDKQYLLKTSYGLMNLAKEVGEDWEAPENGRPSLTSVLGKLALDKKWGGKDGIKENSHT